MNFMVQETFLRDKERSQKEVARLQGLLENLEANHSTIKEECVDLKEKLNRASLAKDVLEQEKTHLMEMFNKTEAQKETLDAESKM